MTRVSPAEYVIETIGGVRKTARIVGCSPSAVSAWRDSDRPHALCGAIPRKRFKRILGYAKFRKLDITINDLVFGRISDKKKKRA